MTFRFVIADDEPITRMDLREILESEGHEVVGEASDGFDAVELCKTYHPDMVLMDIKMPLLDGLNASKIIMEEELADGILLLTAYSSKNFVKKATAIGVIGYLVKPITEESLSPMIEIGIAQISEKKRMQKDILDAKTKLANRKIIERAKGRLMDQHGISENDAYVMMQKLSMDKRCSLIDIAKVILLND